MAKKPEKKIVTTLKTAAKKEGDLLGMLTWWSLEGAAIEVAGLKALYQKHGLADEWLPGEITGTLAFNKTIREVKRSADGYMIRPIKEDEQEIVIGVVAEARDKAAETLSYDQEVTIKFVKGTDTIKSTSEQHPIVQRVRALYDGMTRTYVVQDFIRLLTRNVRRKMSAVLVRPTGGVYFVPRGPMLDVLAKHEAVFNELGDVEFTAIPMHDDPKTKTEIAKKARKALEVELKEIEEEIEKFKTEEPRRDTLERRFGEFKELKKKASLFADMLSIKVSDLHESLDEAAKQITSILGVVEAKLEKGKEKNKEYRRNYSKEWKRRRAEEQRAVKAQARETNADVRVVVKVDELVQTTPLGQVTNAKVGKVKAQAPAPAKATKKVKVARTK